MFLKTSIFGKASPKDFSKYLRRSRKERDPDTGFNQRNQSGRFTAVASGLFNAFRYLGTVFSSLLTGVVMGGSFNSGGLRVLGMLGLTKARVG